MARDEEAQDALIDLNLDFDFDPQITQRVLAAIDRSDDPHLHIDILRRAVYQQAAKLQQFGSALKRLQDAERKRLTESGVFRAIKADRDQRQLKWFTNWRTWIVRGLVAAAGTAFLSVMAWVLKLAWKGLTT